MIRKSRTQKEIPTPRIEVGKTKLIIRKHIIKRVSSCFPIGAQTVTRNKNMKAYIRFKQHKNSTPKHKINGTTT